MKNPLLLTIACTAAASVAASASPAPAKGLQLKASGDSTVITVEQPSGVLMLPIQESAPEARVRILPEHPDTPMDIHLAVDQVDYYVPVRNVESLSVKGSTTGAVWADKMELRDSYTPENREKFRPVYHHTPMEGWMNDPNGMYYDPATETYHLYYQYNPYGSMWGNLAWGHSTSKDMVNWEHQPVALERDAMGHIFSGSCVIDHNNTAGYGNDAVIAFYTSASDKNGQIQCMAYSTDGGQTFTKYEGNPVLTPFDGLRDFRDPNVFWHEPTQKWIMIVSADKNMRFYSSDDLKDWTYLSEWGDGYGAQPSQFECPDFFPLPVDGDDKNQKWVMVVNINPGFLFGGSGTEYFIGEFDGTKFIPDDAQNVTKWMDYGKDHYASVSFSGTPDGVNVIPWMSNWQYATILPTLQYRSANGVVRRTFLFKGRDGEIYMGQEPVKELEALRGAKKVHGSLSLNPGQPKTIDMLLPSNDGAMELNMEVCPTPKGETTLTLANDKGEDLKIVFDMEKGRVYMDRENSSTLNCKVDQIKGREFERRNEPGYAPKEFAVKTYAPLSLAKKADTFAVRLLIDRSSCEMFIDGGRIAMTNLIFPDTPFNTLSLSTTARGAKVKNITAYSIK